MAKMIEFYVPTSFQKRRLPRQARKKGGPSSCALPDGRWWVVHLWVEGFFEVFATVVIAFLFTRLKLLSVASATRAVLIRHA